MPYMDATGYNPSLDIQSKTKKNPENVSFLQHLILFWVRRKKTHLFTIGINEYLQEWVINHQSCFRFVASYMDLHHFTVFELRHDFVEVMSTVDQSTPLFVSWLVSQ